MKRWLATAAALAMSVSQIAGSAVAGSCVPTTGRRCAAKPAINFSSVPDISKEIVSQEPATAKPVTQTLDAPPITTYTGPIVGVDSMIHAPTVGYYWSLDSDSDKH